MTCEDLSPCATCCEADGKCVASKGAVARKGSLSTSYPTGQGQLSHCRTQHAIHAPYGSPYAVPTHIFSRAAVPLGGAARDGIVALTIIGASVEIRVLPP